MIFFETKNENDVQHSGICMLADTMALHLLKYYVFHILESEIV